MKKFIVKIFNNAPMSESMSSISILLFRVFAGAIMLPYGFRKIANFDLLTLDFFGDPIGIGMLPSLLLNIFAQILCSLTLILGLFSRLSAFILAFDMAVASFYHAQDDLATFSLPLVFFAMYLYLTISGGGCYSLDSLIFKKNRGSI